jgi:ABC-2 type transport system permease protein
MSADMKYVVDRHAPLVNRFNPAAVITDAFYCINVYDDPARFGRSLVTLGVMCVGLTLASFLLIRRERYDSI